MKNRKHIKRKKSLTQRLISFLKMSTDDVLTQFASLDGAIRVGEGLRQFVYIKGNKKNKVLLVSHSDTVFDNEKEEEKLKIEIKNSVIYSTNSNMGLGADDRAGCTILWELRNSGHSLLICNGEEQHCLGSSFLSNDKEWSNEINNHQFAIQFDRRSDKDLVFYNVGSPELLKFLKKHYTGYEKAQGSYTDIRELCKTMAGVNISVGYYNEHSPNETLFIDEWKNTLNLTTKMLELEDIPRFEIKSFFQDSASNNNYNPPRIHQTPKASKRELFDESKVLSSIIQCNICHSWMLKCEIIYNNFCCVYCEKNINIPDTSTPEHIMMPFMEEE